jgi:cell division control protein 7
MAAALLSQHSSNPLELPSSDPRSVLYRRKAQRQKHSSDSMSSDDPLNEYHRQDVRQYRTHIAQLFPKMAVPQGKKSKDPTQIADYCGDELDVMMRDSDHEDDEHEDEDSVEEDDVDRDTDAQGETDEEMTIHLKSQGEREEIEEEIADLEEAVPQLTEDYKLVDRLGTGTFSSVYKAIDLGYHDKWDNSPWHGSHPSLSSAYYQSVRHARDSKVFVAIKRIYVTSNPERIRNEIAIMQDSRGCRHVSQLISAFRHEDQVVAVMPYHRNEDFRVCL